MARSRMWYGPEAWRLKRLATFLICLICMSIASPLAGAAEQPETIPPKVEEVLKLLSDPDVQQWMKARRAHEVAEAETAQAAGGVTAFLARRIEALRSHLNALAAVPGGLPAELAQASEALKEAAGAQGVWKLVLLGTVGLLTGFSAQALCQRTISNWLNRFSSTEMVGAVNVRLRLFCWRFASGLVAAIAFAAGAIGFFMLFNWPVLYQTILISIVIAVAGILVVRTSLQALLGPAKQGDIAEAASMRLISMSNESASFWRRTIISALFVMAFGWVLSNTLQAIGVSSISISAIIYTIGIVLLSIGFVAVWSNPEAGVSVAEGEASKWRRTTRRTLFSIYITLVWLTWISGALNLFWMLVVFGCLPVAIRFSREIAAGLFPARTADIELRVPSIASVLVERGLRALCVIVAVLVLAKGWSVDLAQLAEDNTRAGRLVAGGLLAVVILLVADFIWQLLSALITVRLAQAEIDAPLQAKEAQRRTRLLTLLPVLRNVLFVMIAMIAVLMALSAMGVEIAPLLAGAGVAGVAIGFGAQTLVKDIISGMFYLLDDAFRVGEYIESGKFKGTVESFSLRSVRLRHHNGPVFTVPFAELGAVQNMSRDWVITKFDVGVTYDSDIQKARKIIKTIGQELAEDPEFKQDILEPLKMQGIQELGDFAVQLRVKMMTRPGGQFVIKRKALAMIKSAFEENEIKIASPILTVPRHSYGNQIGDMHKEGQIID